MVNCTRYYKRISALKDLGMQVKVLAFERGSYPGKELSGKHISLGHIKHGHYLSRLVMILKAIYKVRSMIKNADVLYTCGLDMALLGWLAALKINNKPKLCYEVADIREIQLSNGLAGRITRAFERFMIKQAHLLIVTSSTYVSAYYKGILGAKNFRYQVIENKLDPRQIMNSKLRLLPKSPPEAHLKIGYFGVLRCARSLQVIKHLVSKYNGSVEVYLRGIFFKDIGVLEHEVVNTSGIYYEGPFKSPDDLPEMYSKVDIVWDIAKYHEGKVGNLSWAKSNRFYQSCFFNKPIIGQVNTLDGIAAEELDIGISLDISDIDRAVDKIMSITKHQLEHWKKNLSNISKEVYVLTDEHERLIKEMRKQVNRLS